MRKEMLNSLLAKAELVAGRFSNPDRENNHNNETFSVYSITPTSEYVGLVTYKKNTGRFALAVFFYVNGGVSDWFYFFPSDSHILGFMEIKDAKARIEKLNSEVKTDV